MDKYVANVVSDYLKWLLDNLIVNDLNQIKRIKQLAEDENQLGELIVNIIARQIPKLKDSGRKLVILYLIDFIVKNTTKGNYVELFGIWIEQVFHDIYKVSNKRIRNKMLKTRSTWERIFPLELLNCIDDVIQRIEGSHASCKPIDYITID